MQPSKPKLKAADVKALYRKTLVAYIHNMHVVIIYCDKYCILLVHYDFNYLSLSSSNTDAAL